MSAHGGASDFTTLLVTGSHVIRLLANEMSVRAL